MHSRMLEELREDFSDRPVEIREDRNMGKSPNIS